MKDCQVCDLPHAGSCTATYAMKEWRRRARLAEERLTRLREALQVLWSAGEVDSLA